MTHCWKSHVAAHMFLSVALPDLDYWFDLKPVDHILHCDSSHMLLSLLYQPELQTRRKLGRWKVAPLNGYNMACGWIILCLLVRFLVSGFSVGYTVNKKRAMSFTLIQVYKLNKSQTHREHWSAEAGRKHIHWRIYLRIELDFWNVHGIMNTLGLLQNDFAKDTKYSWFHEHSKKWFYCLYLHSILNI